MLQEAVKFCADCISCALNQKIVDGGKVPSHGEACNHAPANCDLFLQQHRHCDLLIAQISVHDMYPFSHRIQTFMPPLHMLFFGDDSRMASA